MKYILSIDEIVALKAGHGDVLETCPILLEDEDFEWKGGGILQDFVLCVSTGAYFRIKNRGDYFVISTITRHPLRGKRSKTKQGIQDHIKKHFARGML